MNTHDRVASLWPSGEWAAVCAAQRTKGLEKHGRTVESYPGTAPYWADHGAQEAADGAVYALRVTDAGHPVRGRLAALLFVLAGRLLLPLTRGAR